MMAHFCEGEGEGGGIRMRDMLRAFSLFPWFAFLSLLIPWQTLMRLQLPGSANSTSIIHPVQLHPLNTHPHAYTHTHIIYTHASHTQTSMHSNSLKHTYIHHSYSPLSHGLTPCCHCHKSLALFIHGRAKYELKSSRKEVTPEAFFQRLVYHSRRDWLLSLKGRWQALFRLQHWYTLLLCLH